MRVNKKYLEGGKTLYMWIENWVLNASGDGELWMDDSLEYALSRNPSHKIFKVTLEEIETEKYEDQEVTTVTKTRVKQGGVVQSNRRAY
jgi:hypothetical protein